MLMCPYCGWQYDPEQESKRRATKQGEAYPL